MKNFETFITTSFTELDKVFSELNNLFDEFRVNGINMQFDSRVELKDAYKFTKETFDKVEENLIRLNSLITTGIVHIMAEEKSEDRDEYLLSLAEVNMAIAMKKNNMFTDLYEDFKPMHEDAKRFLEENN